MYSRKSEEARMEKLQHYLNILAKTSHPESLEAVYYSKKVK